jgi:hypothetical protein
MKRRIPLALAFVFVFGAGLAFGKHEVTVKDVSRDLDQVQNHIRTAASQMPGGTLVSLQLSMAQQATDRARQHLMEFAEQQRNCSDVPK